MQGEILMTPKVAEHFGLPTTYGALQDYVASQTGAHQKAGFAGNLLSKLGLGEEPSPNFQVKGMPSDQVSQAAELVRSFYEVQGYDVVPVVARRSDMLKMEYFMRHRENGNRITVNFEETPSADPGKVDLSVRVLDLDGRLH